MSVAAQLQILVSANTAQATAALNRLDATTKRTAASAQASGTAMERAFGRRGAMAAKGGILAMGAALYGSIKVGMDFEKQMSSLAAVTGATDKQMGKLEAQARELGRSTIFSATEVADAQGELAKGGLKLGQILGGALPAALSLAAAGELDLATAAKTVTNAMNLFGLEGKDTVQVADMLATAANTTTADVGDFAMALSQGGSAAKQVGFTLNDTVVVLEALAEAGIKNSDAGTSMKTALLQLVAPTSKQAKLAKALGIEFLTQAGEMKGPIALAGELRRELGGMTKAQRAATLKVLAGTDGFRTLAALYDLGAKNARKLAKANEEVGTAEETAAEKTDNLAGDLERLSGTIQDKALDIYDTLEPQLRDAAQLLEKGLGHVEIPDIDIGEMLKSGDPVTGIAKQIGTDIGQSLGGGVSSAARGAFNKVKSIAGKGADIALGIGGNAVGQAKSIWNKVKGVAGRAITFVLGLPGNIVGKARGLWGKIKGVLGDAIDIAVHLPGVGGIVSAARYLWDKINSALPDIEVNVDVKGAAEASSRIGSLGLARGTDNWQGGTAMVGEQGRELMRYGDKWAMLGQKGPHLANVPKGAEVFTASETRQLLAAGIPGFAQGKRTKAEIKAARQAKRERKLAKQQAGRESILLNLEAILAGAELTAGFGDDIKAINALMGYWRGVAQANKNAVNSKNPLRRKAGLEKLLEARQQMKSYTEMLADLTGGTNAPLGGVDDSERVALLQEMLSQANLRTAVSQAQYGVLKGMPPYGGSFANGGIVPGPAGAARTVVAHGGEPIGAGAVQVTINGDISNTPKGKDPVEVVINDRRFKAAVRNTSMRGGARRIPGV